VNQPPVLVSVVFHASLGKPARWRGNYGKAAIELYPGFTAAQEALKRVK
jgi:hypothetical protein